MSNKSEIDNFHWHCEVAALLIRSLPSNPATKSNIRHAIRLATLCCTGKRGIRYATSRACGIKNASTADWYKLGLIREHVFPVGEVVKKVLEGTVSPSNATWEVISKTLTAEDLQFWPPPSDMGLAPPLPAVIASLVRKYSLVAWASKEDDRILRSAGLGKKMPPGFADTDLFARYTYCKIDLVDLHQNREQGAP